MTGVNFKTLAVLIIDDEPFIRDLIGRVLRDQGVPKVYYAANGRVAFEIMMTLTDRLDIVICDLEMPEMDGFGFVERLRKHDDSHLASLPVLILTGHSQKGNVEMAVKLGIHGFLTKPVSVKDLTTRIQKALTSPSIDPNQLKRRPQAGRLGGPTTQ